MKQIWAIVFKDIITELRSKELVTSMLTFAILILIIFHFAFNLSTELIRFAAPAILWVSFTFAGVLGLSRSFAIENEGNSVQGLLLTPVDRTIIYFGKMIGNLIFVLIVEILVIPLFVLFFNENLFTNIISLTLIIALGTVGFVSVGTLLSAIAINTKLREVLLPILLFPIIIPVIANSVKLTASILDGNQLKFSDSALQVLVSFDIIFIAASAVTFEFVLDES